MHKPSNKSLSTSHILPSGPVSAKMRAVVVVVGGASQSRGIGRGVTCKVLGATKFGCPRRGTGAGAREQEVKV